MKLVRFGKAGSEKQSTNSIPKRRWDAPVLHPFSGCVIATDLLVRVVVLSDDRKLSHIKRGISELRNRLLRHIVVWISSDYIGLFGHNSRC